MNRLWNWLREAVENYPVAFVILGGIGSYALAFGVLLVASQFFGGIGWMVGGIFLSIFIVFFHWFVARYEKQSWIAQIIAIGPAIGLVYLIIFASLILRFD